jgi:xylulokinase
VVTVGIDIGTTSVKALAVDGQGRVLSRARLVHGVEVPGPGRLQHDAVRAWRDAPALALATVAAALPDPGAVAAVAVAAMVPSLAAVDAEGRPLGPGVLYGDERAREDGTVAGLDPIRSAETVGLLRWAASAHPGAAGYWPAQAVANRSLGGPGSIDLTTAFAAGVLFGGSGWDTGRCAAVGVDPARLPSVELFGQPIGEVGVAAPGATLVAGGVDAFCEQLVVGRLAPGDVLVICGSTLVVWVVAEGAPQVDDLWTMPDLTPGRSLVGGPSNAGGLFLDWVDRALRPAGADQPDPHAVPVWQPFLRGERVPLHDPGRRATVAGLDLTQGPAALRRGAFEASAMALRHIVERAGASPSRIVATGGGSRVRSWMQAIADVTAVPVEPVAVAEGGALGAAWLARMGVGLEESTDHAVRWAASEPLVHPDPVWVGPTGDRYRRYLEALRTGGVTAAAGGAAPDREGWGP